MTVILYIIIFMNKTTLKKLYFPSVCFILLIVNGHVSIVRIPPFLNGGEVNFKYLPQRGQIWKIKKIRWKYGAGAGLLKRWGWRFSYLIFSRFIIFAFRNYFTLCKILLCIWRKKNFLQGQLEPPYELWWEKWVKYVNVESYDTKLTSDIYNFHFEHIDISM